MQPTAVPLDNAFIDIGPDRARILPKDWYGITKDEGSTISWDPGVSGILFGESLQSKSSDHGGDRHDGDEVLYLISGSIRLSLESDDKTWTEIPVQPGEVIIVPRGVWHQLESVSAPRRRPHRSSPCRAGFTVTKCAMRVSTLGWLADFINPSSRSSGPTHGSLGRHTDRGSRTPAF